MSGPYRYLGQKLYFQGHKIVADKYHVVRQVAWAFENVRKAEQKKFHEQRRKYFKRSRKLLLKRPDKLTPDEAFQVESMLRISGTIKTGLCIKK